MLKKAIASIAVQLLGLIFGLAAGVIVARALGPTAKGTITLYAMLLGALATLGNLGMGAALVHQVSSRALPPGKAWANSWWLSWLWGSALAVMVFFGAPLLGLALKRPLDMGLWTIALMGLPLAILFDCQANLLRGLQEIGRFNWLMLWRQIFRLGALLGLVVLLQYGVPGALWSLNISLAAGAALGLWWIWRSGILNMQPSWSHLRRSLAYGLKALPGQMLQYLNYRVDIFILAAFTTAGQVGWYTTAVFAAELVWYLPNGVNVVFLPQVSAEADPRQRDDMGSRTIRHTFFWALVLSSALAAWARPLILFLYGDNFLPAAQALPVLLIGVLTMVPGKLALNHLAGIGRPQYLSYAALMGLGLTILLDMLMIPRWGLMGAAWASSLAYLTVAAAALYWLKRIAGLSLRQSLIPRPEDLSLYHRLFLS